MPEDAGGVRDKIDKKICKYDITDCLPILMGVVINISTICTKYKRQFQLVTGLFLAFYDLLVQNAAKLRYRTESFFFLYIYNGLSKACRPRSGVY